MTDFQDWLHPLYFVDCTRVNLDDLATAVKPGSIIRCEGDPREVVQVIYPEGSHDFVAGMVSENE